MLNPDLQTLRDRDQLEEKALHRTGDQTRNLSTKFL